MKGQAAKSKGRPSNNTRILERIVAAHSPDVAGPNVFKGYGSAVDLMEETGLDAKLSRISGIIASRLGNAVSDGKKLRDSESGPGGAFEGLRPWQSDDYPENVVFWAEAEFFANDRIVAALTAHLVEHIAIGEELRQIALSARRRAEEELVDVPAGMVEFANRLTACGITRDEVRFMSRDRLEKVIAAIRGVDADGVDLVPDRLPMDEFDVYADGTGAPTRNGLEDGSDVGAHADAGSPAETVEESPADTGSQGLDGEVRQDGQEQGFDGLSERDDPVSVEAVEDVAIEAPEEVPEPVAGPPAPPRPKGRWDDLDLEPLGYRIEEVPASTDADMEAMRMKLPDVSSLNELAVPKSPDVMLTDGAMGQKDRSLLDKFLMRYSDRMQVRIGEMEKRIIALLLVDLPGGGKGRMMGARGWYHGVVLPGVEGSSRIRRVVSIDQSEAALKDAFSL